jgi:hypothetical protein
MGKVLGALFGCGLAFAAIESAHAITCDLWGLALFGVCR